MSIIYDALKKVQDNNINTSTTTKKEEIKNPSLQHKRPSSLLPTLFFIVSGIFLGKFLFDFIMQDQISLPSVNISSSMPMVPIANKQDVPVKNDNFATSSPLISNLPSLVLNGVFFTDEKAYALINNQVVRENDTIQGARVVAIKSNGVDLDFNGREFTLNVD